MKSLTFSNLRAANALRQGQYGSCLNWTPSQWLQALVGEIGEFANFRKKYERGDMTDAEFAVAAAKELADIQIYLDILARRCLDKPNARHPEGVDLGKATIAKFNEVSRRRKLNVWLTIYGDVFVAGEGYAEPPEDQ